MSFVEQYKKYHAEEEHNFPGNSLRPQLRHIVDLVQDTKSKTLLDWASIFSPEEKPFVAV